VCEGTGRRYSAYENEWHTTGGTTGNAQVMGGNSNPPPKYLSLVGFAERIPSISGPLLFIFGEQRRRGGNRCVRRIFSATS
jgi:hypothetical protein